MTNFKIPTTWWGEDGKTNYERIMRGERDKPKEQTQAAQNSGKDLADFIYVPSIKLYVAKERTHLGKNWFDCHKELQKDNQRMLIIPEFIEFLKYIKNSNNQEYQNIYKDITEVRDPLRAEWLDADFKVKDKKLHINYNHILNSNGELIPKNSEILDSNNLMQDKTPGINLDDWLKSPTKQGFPKKDISNGNLYYWFPRSDNNSVAGFYADSDRASLNCNWSPSNSYSDLGVRRCKVGLA